MPHILTPAEEILNTNSALWFSPDGTKLAYASLNDTLVGTVPVPHYGAHQQYPTMYDLRYPKVSRCLSPTLAPAALTALAQWRPWASGGAGIG